MEGIKLEFVYMCLRYMSNCQHIGIIILSYGIHWNKL
jgi:hypothetical protein